MKYLKDTNTEIIEVSAVLPETSLLKSKRVQETKIGKEMTSELLSYIIFY